MKTLKIILLTLLAFLILTVGIVAYWFALDKEVPDMELNSDVAIDYQAEITEDELVDLVVKSVSDDKTATGDIKVRIANFDELDTNTLGTQKVNVIAEDEVGKEVLIAEEVEVRKSPEQLLAEAQTNYTNQLNELDDAGLFSTTSVEEYQGEIAALTVDNYKDYQTTLDQYKADRIKSIYEKNQEKIEGAEDDIKSLEDMKFNANKYQERLDDIYKKDEDMQKVIDANSELNELLEDLDEEVAKQKELEKQSAELADQENEDDKDSDDKESDDKDSDNKESDDKDSDDKE